MVRRFHDVRCAQVPKQVNWHGSVLRIPSMSPSLQSVYILLATSAAIVIDRRYWGSHQGCTQSDRPRTCLNRLHKQPVRVGELQSNYRIILCNSDLKNSIFSILTRLSHRCQLRRCAVPNTTSGQLAPWSACSSCLLGGWWLMGVWADSP